MTNARTYAEINSLDVIEMIRIEKAYLAGELAAIESRLNRAQLKPCVKCERRAKLAREHDKRYRDKHKDKYKALQHERYLRYKVTSYLRSK